LDVQIENQPVEILLEDVTITADDVPGLPATNKGELTVALDIAVTEVLKAEGIAREIVNKIQNIRKDNGYEVSDKITIKLKANETVHAAIKIYSDYIKSQVLAAELTTDSALSENSQDAKVIEIDEDTTAIVIINKI
jgi:isoleucyl-tRNA synthetase